MKSHGNYFYLECGMGALGIIVVHGCDLLGGRKWDDAWQNDAKGMPKERVSYSGCRQLTQDAEFFRP